MGESVNESKRCTDAAVRAMGADTALRADAAVRAMRSVALVLALAFVAMPVLGEGRDFAGTVVAASASELVVESRMGDRRSFARSDATKVAGARSKWGDLRKGDSVVVSWSLGDAASVARKVRVTAAGGG